MQEIKTEVDISAPPSKVWGIITDINSWQEWSPIINASQGMASVGSKLNITMMSKEEGKDGPNYSPVITGLSAIGNTVEILANLEGLDAHARAISIRREQA